MYSENKIRVANVQHVSFWIAYEAVKKADLLNSIYDLIKGKALQFSHIKI